MRSLFRSKHRVTQPFGVNTDYYKKFGLAGHEGIDLVPTGTVWDVLCLADGVVVKDDDIAGEPLQDAYGKFVTVWHPSINKATQYCHLKENYVSLGDKVTYGQKIGLMGSTGNSTGAHVHLNVFDVDAQGVRLNKNNGYLGGIDPQPFLDEEPEKEQPVDQVCMSKSQADDFQRVKDGWNKVREKLNVEDSVTVVIAEVDKLIKYEEKVLQSEKTIAGAKDQIAKLLEDLTAEKERNEKLLLESNKIVDKAEELEKKYQQAVQNSARYLEQIDALKKDLAEPNDGITLIIKGLRKLIGR